MENQVQTIVCPNCGARATNSHNCEYCGSFLVQRAAEGIDVSNYVEQAALYHNPQVEAMIKLYSDTLKQVLGQTRNGEDKLILTFKLGSSVGLFLPDKNLSGYGIVLGKQFLKKAGLLDSFCDSTLRTVFSEYPGEYGSYRLDFGYDYEGATSVLLQLFELFGEDPNSQEYRLQYADNHIVYDNQGSIIESNCDYQNKGIVEALISKQETIEKGCAGMFAILLAAGIGSTYGIVELIKLVLA